MWIALLITAPPQAVVEGDLNWICLSDFLAKNYTFAGGSCQMLRLDRYTIVSMRRAILQVEV